jgi:Family of unknown function (DUF6113)
MPSRVLDAVSLAVALLVGAAAGTVGAFLHAASVLGLPAGLLLALGLGVAGVVSSGVATGSRLGAGLALAGWLVTVFLLSLPRPEGDLVLPARWQGYGFLYGGALLLSALLARDYRRAAEGRGPAPRG